MDLSARPAAADGVWQTAVILQIRLYSRRRAEIAALGVKALVAGNIATMMIGAVAGIIIAI